MHFPAKVSNTIPVLAGIIGALCAVAGAAFGVKGLILCVAGCIGIVTVIAVSYRPWFGVVLIAFALPFERVASIDIGGFTLRISQVLLLLTIATTLTHMLFGRIRLRMSGAYLGLAVFLLGAAIALPASVNPFRGITTLAFMLFTITLTLLLPNLLISSHRMRIVLVALLAGALLTSIFGLFQFAGDLAGIPPEITGLRDLYTKEVFGFPRVQSTALEPLYYANYLLLPIALAAIVMLRKQKPFQLLSAAVLVVGLPVFILTLSRAAYIAAAGMFLLIVILLFRQFFKPSRIILLILLAIVTFVAVTYAFSLTGDQETTVSTFTRQAQNLFVGASYADRVSTSEAAIDLFKQHPLGIGPGNFGPSIAAHPLVEPKGGWLIVNNIYLEVAAEEGIIGLVGFLAFLAYVLTQVGATALKSVDQFQKTVALSAFVAITAICVQYLTFSIFYIMHIWFALGIALAISSPWYKKI